MKWLKSKKEIPILPALEGYNLWAATYGNESNPIKNLSDELVKKFLPDLKGKKVLDAGCGAGKFCLEAERQHALKVVGIDLSPEMIHQSQKICTQTQFICSEISNADVGKDEFDVIICALVLGHIENFQAALDNLLNALKQGGTIIITDFHPFLTLLRSKRTFKDSATGKTFEVRHYLHLFTQYFDCFRKHNASIEFLEEPMFQGNPVIFALSGLKH